jgi:hypothetical protein
MRTVYTCVMTDRTAFLRTMTETDDKTPNALLVGVGHCFAWQVTRPFWISEVLICNHCLLPVHFQTKQSGI